MTLVKLHHIRSLGYCSRGARKFFARHGLDWSSFIVEGIPAEELQATGDAMAMRAIAVAEEEMGDGRQ